VRNLKTFDTLKEISIKIPTEIETISSNKLIKFNNRSPIFKALMKLEFEKAIREYLKQL
jgi:hypothetical protein